MMKRAALAILALLMFGPCVKADTVDIFSVNGNEGAGGRFFDLAPFIVPSSSIPEDGVYFVNGGCGPGCGGTVAGFIDGIPTQFSVLILGPDSGGPDLNLISMACDSPIIQCAAQMVVGLAGSYTLSNPFGPPFDQPMNFIPGVYDGGQLTIVGPFSTPEPGTLPLMAAGLVGLGLWRRRFLQA